MDAASLLITEELGHRPSRPPNFAAENRALDALAREMAAHPRAALRKLAVVATELCRADAAGVSILEHRSDTDLFCSRAVAGKLGAHVDALMPSLASPCGVALASNTVLLFSRLTEQRFPAVRHIDPAIFETLLAPIHKGREPIGTVWVCSHDPVRKFDAEDARLLKRLAHFASAAHQLVAALDSVTALQHNAIVQVRVQEQLRQAQKMEAIGQLTGGIAHDFNNKLQSIGGSLEMLQRRVEQGRIPEAARYIETARSEVERAAAFTHQLLASARRQTLQPRQVTLDRCISSIAALIRQVVGPRIEVEFVMSGQANPVLCDVGQLESALLSLAANARDAMPGGGALTIATANRILTAADLLGQDGAKPGDYAEISVTDSGTGMAAGVAERAFEPFFTTKPVGQGAGLGLSQIYGFARQSGGLTSLESTPGEGTTVRLLLPCKMVEVPVVETPVPEMLKPQRREASNGHDSTVLLVEDEENVRALVAGALREQGHTVLEAADGLAGARVLQSGTRVDLLVTDVGLPGMNGRELADAARADRPSLPVLLITGYPGAALDVQLAPGMEVINKPFTLDVLAGKARGMVDAATHASAVESRLAAIG